MLQNNFFAKKMQKNGDSYCKIKIFAISLHPQSRNDGGIAQLVRAHDS